MAYILQQSVQGLLVCIPALALFFQLLLLPVGTKKGAVGNYFFLQAVLKHGTLISLGAKLECECPWNIVVQEGCESDVNSCAKEQAKVTGMRWCLATQ